MNQQALVSVIIPCYKVEKYLSKCVDSILAQTYRNLEIILVDDGSPDASGEIAEHYAAKEARVRVIHKENGGLSSARNAGLEIAVGDYVTFVDSDDWVEPDAYEAMVSAAEKYGVKMVIAGRVDESEEGVTIGLCPEREECISGLETAGRIFRWDHMDSSACDKIFARELFREIRFPLGRISEDVLTTYRLAILAERVVLLPKPVYHYVHRVDSITTGIVITEKFFHNVQNTAKVYADICANYPTVEEDARYLRIKSLGYTLLALEQADAASRERFQEAYWEIRKELKEHLAFLTRSRMFSLRDKVQDHLLAYGLYLAFRKLYHSIKRS